MRKNAGIRLNSQNKNQWKKLSAVKEPKRPDFEDQHEAVEEAGHVVHAMRRVDRHERDDGGEQEHQRAQAVDAEVILNAERRRPDGTLDEADASVAGQARPDEERHDKAGQRGDQRDAARVLAREERDCRADERQHGEERENRKAAGEAVAFVHGRLLQKRMTASATTATARMRR